MENHYADAASKDGERTVRFAEYEDIFIIRDGDNGGEDDLGLSCVIERETRGAGRSAFDIDPSEWDFEEEEDSQYHKTDHIRESMRNCVHKWSSRPYWQLLEGCVNDEEGEATDVQKYITTHGCLEVDGDSPRGLERQLCRGHHEARRALHDKATNAILAGDFKLRYEEYNSDDEIWKKLRHISKEHSRGAKALARKFGKADEVAAQTEADTAQVLELVEELKEKIESGSLRVKKTSSYSTKRDSNHSSSSGRRSSSRSLDPLGKGSDHSSLPSSSYHYGKHKKDRRSALLRLPSMSSKSKKDKKHHGDHAADLFHEIDKKGKTTKSSPWRSLKKKISKTVHNSSRDTAAAESWRTR